MTALCRLAANRRVTNRRLNARHERRIDRNEGSRQRTFAEQVVEDLRNLEPRRERVGGRARTEEMRHERLSRQAEDARY